MDLSEKILKTSLDLMMRIGPQSVTMDMVARDCGISKRTLYETFPYKHSLIIEVIEYNQQQTNAKFMQIFEQSANSFEALMGVYTVAREFIRKTSPVFITDIKRLYPEAFDEYKAQEAEIRELIQTKVEVEERLSQIKAKILEEMTTKNVKLWATDTMRLTRKLPSTRTAFNLAQFKQDHPDMNYDDYMKESQVSGSLLIAV